MNEVEELRVIEALRAIPGGLTVTEHDIIDASTRMQHNLKSPAPRRNRALLAVAAAVVLIVGIATFQAITGDEQSAPAPAGTPSPADTLASALQANPYAIAGAEFRAGTRPTAEDLVGVWLLRAPFAGSLVVNGDLEWGYASVRKAYVGSSTLDGRTWTRNVDGVCPSSGPGRLDPQPWTASIAGDGSLRLVFAGTTNTCTPADDHEVWDRLAPGPSPVVDYLRATSGDIDWAAPTDSGLTGFYVNTESRHVLEVAEDGSYSYLDSVTGPEFTPSDQGTLDLGVGAISGTCGSGSFSTTFEVGQSVAVLGYLPAQDLVRIAAADACSPGIGAGGVWLKVL